MCKFMTNLLTRWNNIERRRGTQNLMNFLIIQVFFSFLFFSFPSPFSFFSFLITKMFLMLSITIEEKRAGVTSMRSLTVCPLQRIPKYMGFTRTLTSLGLCEEDVAPMEMLEVCFVLLWNVVIKKNLFSFRWSNS